MNYEEEVHMKKKLCPWHINGANIPIIIMTLHTA
jgi:hypothetical protein